MTDRIARFLDERRPATPCLVIDLDRIERNYSELRRLLPLARVFYAVKANPAPEVIRRLAGLGSSFDAASGPEIRLCLEHGAPPDRISVHGKSFDLVTLDNPFRPLQQSDPAEFARHLENGRRVYFENCFYCHGDAMRGDGMYARGLNPIPTNFADAGAIALLQESFLFWRIAKGGPGLPEEGGPWDTAMPAWEKFLTEEEMWDVILFLYDFSNQRPRAREEVHE